MHSRTPTSLKQRICKHRQHDHDRANGMISKALKNLLAAPCCPFLWCYYMIWNRLSEMMGTSGLLLAGASWRLMCPRLWHCRISLHGPCFC